MLLLLRVVGCLNWYEMCVLGQSIKNDPNNIKLPQSLYQSYHIDHSCPFSLSLSYRPHLSHTTQSLVFIFHMLKIKTQRYILNYIPLHRTPSIILFEVPIHLGNPRVDKIS